MKRIKSLLFSLIAMAFAVNWLNAQEPVDKPPELTLPVEGEVKVLESFVKVANTVDWNVALINADKVWDRCKVKVDLDVFDTGIDDSHPEFKGLTIKHKNYTNSRTEKDIQGHGSHCFGTIGAQGQVTGVARPVIGVVYNRKVLDDQGNGNFTAFRRALADARAAGSRVVSASLGTGPTTMPVEQFDRALEAEIVKCLESGMIINCWAAGNAGPGANTVGFPGRYGEKYPDIQVVAACDRNRQIASFSSRGAAVNVTAPGVAIVSPLPGGKYGEWDGTSMATPHIAGLAVLFVSYLETEYPGYDRKQTNKLFTECLRLSCSFPDSKHPARGYGLPDAVKLFAEADKKLAGSKPIPPVVPPGDGVYRPIQLSFDDLTPEAQRKLLLIGYDTFELRIGQTNPIPQGPKLVPVKAPQPTPVQAPQPFPRVIYQGAQPIAQQNCPGGVCPPQQGFGVPIVPQQVFPQFQPFGGRFRR